MYPAGCDYSKRVGLNRIKGTLLGGFVGMLVLLFEQAVIPPEFPLLSYVLISLMIIVVIYLTVLLHMTSASYISCVVFMSITVSHALDVNPYLFAFHRILDTLIGIVVAFVINAVHLPRGHHQKTVFVSTLDALCDEKGTWSVYTKVKIKQLLEQKANIALVSTSTPGSFLPNLKDISLTLPIITMHGAAMYDMQKQEYHHCHRMHQELVQEITHIFEEAQSDCFVYTIKHHMLQIYYRSFSHPRAEAYYHHMRKLPYQAFICHPLPAGQEAVYLYAIDESCRLQDIRKHIQALPNQEQLHICYEEYEGFATLSVYAGNASEEAAIQQMMDEHDFTTRYMFYADAQGNAFMDCDSREDAQSRKEKNKQREAIGLVNKDVVVRRMETLYRKRSA